MQALGGNNVFSTLMRLDDLLAFHPNLVTFDIANTTNEDHFQAMIEAIVRRIWAFDPSTRIVAQVNGTYNGNTPDSLADPPRNAVLAAAFRSICAWYGIAYVDWNAIVLDQINTHGLHLSDLIADTVHPTALLSALIFEAFRAYLPYGGSARPTPYPDAYYALTPSYELPPQRIAGTSYDSRTGTWTDTGTRTQSTEVGATITFSATCKMIGLYRADTASANATTVSIDGGAFTNLSLSHAGYKISDVAAPHTVVIKVTSGTVRIDEFWAI